MLTNEQVLLWLKSLSSKPSNYYCGVLDDKKEKSFGVYPLKSGSERNVAIGGKETTKTAKHGISILVHWNESTRETQNKAMELYKAIEDAKNVEIGGNKVNYIQLLQDEPISVGRDDRGIDEYVIEFMIWYERS